jgi:hypothetical protein
MQLLLTLFPEIFSVSIDDNTETLHSHTINQLSSPNTIIYLHNQNKYNNSIVNCVYNCDRQY